MLWILTQTYGGWPSFHRSTVPPCELAQGGFNRLGTTSWVLESFENPYISIKNAFSPFVSVLTLPERCLLSVGEMKIRASWARNHLSATCFGEEGGPGPAKAPLCCFPSQGNSWKRQLKRTGVFYCTWKYRVIHLSCQPCRLTFPTRKYHWSWGRAWLTANRV